MYKDILKGPKVKHASKLINEYEVAVGIQVVRIKIWKSIDGYYFHRTSHFYHGPDQGAPYIEARNIYDSEEKALVGAVKQITSFYKEEHGFSESYWIDNIEF